MVDMVLMIFGGVFFLISCYGLLKMLTTARDRVLEMVDGDFLAYISLIAWMLVFIASSAYWIFSSIDFETARSFRRYIHSFTATYFFEGTLCLLLTYGFAKINPEKLNGRVQMSSGKRSFVIVLGIFFGLLAIVLGLMRLVDG